eukprot:gene22433-30686_t
MADSNSSFVKKGSEDSEKTLKWEVEHRTPLGSKIVHFGWKNINPSYFKKYSYNTLTVRFYHEPIPYGIAAYCDWIVTDSFFYGETSRPKFVYVFKGKGHGLQRFLREVVPLVTSPFVLLIASGDVTVPKNTDQRIQRLPGFSSDPGGGPNWNVITTHPMIIHSFIENVDSTHPRVSSLPTGMVRHDYMGCLENVEVSRCKKTVDTHIAELAGNYSWFNIYTRPVWVLSMDRVRSGMNQWADRGQTWLACRVSPFCFTANELGRGLQGPLKNDSVLAAHAASAASNGGKVNFEGDQDQGDFKKMIAQSKFLLIIHGGGLDPSPKCWETIALGTIPILVSGPLDDSYSHLPVAFIKSSTDFLQGGQKSMALLDKWMKELGPYYEVGSEKRNQTLYRLSLGYWWTNIQNKYSSLTSS